MSAVPDMSGFIFRFAVFFLITLLISQKGLRYGMYSCNEKITTQKLKVLGEKIDQEFFKIMAPPPFKTCTCTVRGPRNKDPHRQEWKQLDNTMHTRVS